MLRYVVVALALAVSVASATVGGYAPPNPLIPPSPLRPVQPVQPVRPVRPVQPVQPLQPIPGNVPVQPQPQPMNPAVPIQPQPQPVSSNPLQPQTPAPEVQPDDVNGLQPVEYVDYPEEEDLDAPGFVVQNGIEGYIVPANLLETTKIEPALSFLQRLGLLFGLTKLPKFVVALFPKFAFLFKHFGFLLLLGGALTTAVCTFTPFCGIALGVRTDNEIFSFKTKARDVAEFALNAIDKYRDIARQEAQKNKSKKRRR